MTVKTKPITTTTAWKYLGHVPVDAGSLCIVDPCYLLQGDDHHPLNWQSVCDDFSLQESNRRLPVTTHTFSGEYGDGLLFSGFGGDGRYRVRALVDTIRDNESGYEGQKIRRIVIDLDGSHKQEQDDQAALLAAARAVLEHCALIHKHWGDGCNQKESDAAQRDLSAAIERIEGGAA